MESGTELTKTDVTEFYNSQLSRMVGYENGNGRLNRIKQGLAAIVKPGMTVLDVGCGTGVTSRHMASLGAAVTAIDLSPDLIGYAKSKSSGINYMVMPAWDMYRYDEKFDLIVLADVFEHFIRREVFGTMRCLLSDHTTESALVYLNMPNYAFLKFMKDKYPDKLQIVDEAWSIEDVVSLFSYLGFSPVTMQMYGLDVPAQYIEYVFMREENLSDMFLTRMSNIYKTQRRQ